MPMQSYSEIALCFVEAVMEKPQYNQHGSDTRWTLTHQFEINNLQDADIGLHLESSVDRDR